jgi:hypothetical protein
MVNSFYLLYPEKKNSLKVTDKEANAYVTRFGEMLRKEENNAYFKMLINRQGKMFKGLKCSLLPKFKMEVILNVDENTTEEQKTIINNIWTNIWMLYIIDETNQPEPNVIKISQIAMALDCIKQSTETEKSQSRSVGGEDGLMKLITSQMQEMTNDQKLQVNEMMTAIKTPSGQSDDLIKNILADIKEKCNVPCGPDGKIDSKTFVQQMMQAGTTMSDTYGKKLTSGEIPITDILGMIANFADGSDSDLINELANVSEALQFDKLDINEVMNEFTTQLSTGELKGKIPPELLKTIKELDGDKLKNLDMSSLMETMLIAGSGKEEVKELTAEQKKELEDFYSKMTI